MYWWHPITCDVKTSLKKWFDLLSMEILLIIAKCFLNVLQWDFVEFCFKLYIKHQIISYQQFIYWNSIFVCLGGYPPTREFFTQHYRWRSANFDLCSALVAIGHSGFFSVPHLLWHGASVYNGHLRGPLTLTPFAERLAVNTCFKR